MNKMEERPGKTNRLHPLVWSERGLPLADIIEDASLPTIVKMQMENKAKGKADMASTLQKPLLLYQESREVKVVARVIISLKPGGKDGVTYKEGDAIVVVPVSYPGWFRVLEDETVPLTTVSNIARVMPVSFLSTRKIPGFSLLMPSNAKDTMYEMLEFPVGVYYVHNLYEDYLKYTCANNKTPKRKLLRCLACVSEDGLDILFPLDVRGEFYIVEDRKKNTKQMQMDKTAIAYTLKQLVTMGAFTKPLVLRIIKGDPPSKPCGFTGMIKVVDIIQDRTVIAATLDGTRKLLELPVLPNAKFLYATNAKDLLETGSLRTEMLYMSGGAADVYARGIKVKQNVSIENKDKDNAPDKAKLEKTKAPQRKTDPGFSFFFSGDLGKNMAPENKRKPEPK